MQSRDEKWDRPNTLKGVGLKALIGAAAAFPGPGFLLPTRNHETFAWCLDNGLRLIMQATLMSIGLYNEPVGAYLPSSQY
jgi:hypothetical protein